jgi:hypothetical protein
MAIPINVSKVSFLYARYADHIQQIIPVALQNLDFATRAREIELWNRPSWARTLIMKPKVGHMLINLAADAASIMCLSNWVKATTSLGTINRVATFDRNYRDITAIIRFRLGILS